MVYDPIWNSFVNTGNVNDYITYSKKKNERIKKVGEVSRNNSSSSK